MATKLSLAIPKIREFFEKDSGVYKLTDIRDLLEQNRSDWGLPYAMTSNKFLNSLMEEGKLIKIKLTSENYDPIIRYSWEEPSQYNLALSLRPKSYLSHASAVYLHGLSEYIPKIIYLNKEQSPKPPSPIPPSQESIKKTFSNRQRESKYQFNYKQTKIVILSGKNTGQLEVANLKGSQGEDLRVTRIPRTLIDITVRPAYSGGVFQVLEAFKGAKDKVSINTIMAVLKQLDYAYPYHQAIGFYMARAGFPKAQVDKLKQLGLNYDFYLDYFIPESQKQYDKDWKLFYPKGI